MLKHVNPIVQYRSTIVNNVILSRTHDPIVLAYSEPDTNRDGGDESGLSMRPAASAQLADSVQQGQQKCRIDDERVR